MMFKRPRLRPVSRLVNVGIAACVIFISACGSEPETSEAENEPAPAPTVDMTADPAEKLQAVWSTRALSAPVVDLALSGGNNPLLAAVLDGGDMQLFDLDGQRLTDPVDVGIIAIADGQPVTLDGNALTIFPGIGADGFINAYLYSSQLGEPVGINVLPDADAIGLCAGPASEGGALMRVGYWTEAAPQALIVGHITQTGDALGWETLERIESNSPLGACLIIAAARPIIRSAGFSSDLASLSDADTQTVIGLGTDGQLGAIAEDNSATALPVRNGISVKAPTQITALSALSDVQFGGYPDGVIVIGGEIDGQAKLVFVEPTGLFGEAAE